MANSGDAPRVTSFVVRALALFLFLDGGLSLAVLTINLEKLEKYLLSLQAELPILSVNRNGVSDTLVTTIRLRALTHSSGLTT